MDAQNHQRVDQIVMILCSMDGCQDDFLIVMIAMSSAAFYALSPVRHSSTTRTDSTIGGV